MCEDSLPCKHLNRPLSQRCLGLSSQGRHGLLGGWNEGSGPAWADNTTSSGCPKGC